MRPLLKLIESAEKPYEGCLIKTHDGDILIATKLQTTHRTSIGLDRINPDKDRVINPYGVSTEKPKVGDRIIELMFDRVYDIITVEADDLERCETNHKNGSALRLLIEPHEFTLQDIPFMNLKDGQVLNIYPHYRYKGKVIIMPDNNPTINNNNQWEIKLNGSKYRTEETQSGLYETIEEIKSNHGDREFTIEIKFTPKENNQ